MFGEATRRKTRESMNYEHQPHLHRPQSQADFHFKENNLPKIQQNSGSSINIGSPVPNSSLKPQYEIVNNRVRFTKYDEGNQQMFFVENRLQNAEEKLKSICDKLQQYNYKINCLEANVKLSDNQASVSVGKLSLLLEKERNTCFQMNRTIQQKISQQASDIKKMKDQICNPIKLDKKDLQNDKLKRDTQLLLKKISQTCELHSKEIRQIKKAVEETVIQLCSNITKQFISEAQSLAETARFNKSKDKWVPCEPAKQQDKKITKLSQMPCRAVLSPKSTSFMDASSTIRDILFGNEDCPNLAQFYKKLSNQFIKREDSFHQLATIDSCSQDMSGKSSGVNSDNRKSQNPLESCVSIEMTKVQKDGLTYYIDSEGHLMDIDGFYLTDQDGSQICLNNDHEKVLDAWKMLF